MFSPAEAIGSRVLREIRAMGKMMVFLCASLASAAIPPVPVRQVVKQVHFIGVKSLFVIVLTAAFTGMVLGLQGYYTLRKFAAEGLLGSAVALSLIRELGPVLSALMVTGRAGSAKATIAKSIPSSSWEKKSACLPAAKSSNLPPTSSRPCRSAGDGSPASAIRRWK